jgi:hypothetical protein
MNMHLKNIASGLGAAVLISALGIGVATAPAKADTQSTAAIIGIGAIVGALLLDSSNNQYYYNNGGSRHYVNNNTANTYYQRHPTYRRPSRHPVAMNRQQGNQRQQGGDQYGGHR